MAVYLSPGVYPREQDLSVLPANVGAVTPAFIGTAQKGPMQKPTFVANAQQFIDEFGEPFPESFLGYAALAYFEQGNRAWILRVGVECEQGQASGLSDICIDTSGGKESGWGRIAVFSGIGYGEVCTREISDTDPLNFHLALVSDIDYNDIEIDSSLGAASATLGFLDLNGYTGSIDDSFTMLITSDVPASTSSVLDGATFELTRNSDGLTLVTGTLVESIVAGTSELIDAGDGLVFRVVVSSIAPLADNDTFTFIARPDNRLLSFNVDRQASGTVNEYTIPDGSSYTDAEDFADDINLLIGSGEPYRAIAQDDGTVCFRTLTAGENIQIVSTEGFALEVGMTLYTYDIPRSYLISTDSGPYDITSDNNRVNIQVIDPTETVEIEFNAPVGLGQTGTSLAANINNAGVDGGSRYWRSYALTVPGGDTQVIIETAVDHRLGQLKMQADGSHYKTLRFAEELAIQYPYTRNYETFYDARVALPDPGTITPSSPLSCEVDPASDDCLADSAYFDSIVGYFVAKSAGTWIDSYVLSLEVYTAGEAAGDVAGRFRVIIEDNNGAALEAIDDVSFDPRETRYVANVINEGSAIGGTNGNKWVQWVERPGFLGNDYVNDLSNFENRIPGPITRRSFSGAANGIPTSPLYSSEIDRSIIGNPNNETGIYAFQNPEVYDIDLLVVPGVSTGSVIGTGLQMCEQRGDCMMIVDPPFGLRAQQVVDWHNGILYSDLAQAINSSYGALYHPWLKIFDQFSGNTIFIPPSGHVTAVFARTAETTEQWFAPAGVNRGRLLTPLDTEVDLSMGERDLMYGSGNAVNPIVNFPQDGIVVWGQRTLQRRATALDRVNVRMLLIYIRKAATNFLRQFVFEPNDRITRGNVVNVSNPFLADIAARRGLTAFKVVCDETNNTPERIDRSELHVAYFLKPTRAAEFIVLNLVVLRTDVSFAAEEVLAAGGVVTATANQ
jgi:hypothetical protein